MRYFILADYLIPPFLRFGDQYASTSRGLGREFYIENGYSIPQNYTLVRLNDGAAVRVVFFDADRGLMMIRAASMRSAYAIATAIHGYMAVWLGYGPDRDSPTYFLYPITKVPNPEWTEEEMKARLRNSNWSFGDSEWFRLNSGIELFAHHLESFASIVPVLASDQRLLEALLHFEQSRALFYGYMVGSYYHFHYSRDRQIMTGTELERQYFERRARFELAFVSAFKAIEAVFGTVQLKRNRIDQLFAGLPYSAIMPDAVYRRYHEIFRGEELEITYRDLVMHFLEIRNGTAAHSNRTPPRRLMISEDTLFEIQWFVSALISDAVKSAMGDEPQRTALPVINPQQAQEAS